MLYPGKERKRAQVSEKRPSHHPMTNKRILMKARKKNNMIHALIKLQLPYAHARARERVSESERERARCDRKAQTCTCPCAYLVDDFEVPPAQLPVGASGHHLRAPPGPAGVAQQKHRGHGPCVARGTPWPHQAVLDEVALPQQQAAAVGAADHLCVFRSTRINQKQEGCEKRKL